MYMFSLTLGNREYQCMKFLDVLGQSEGYFHLWVLISLGFKLANLYANRRHSAPIALLVRTGVVKHQFVPILRLT